jgi:hypothetical protein
MERGQGPFGERLSAQREAALPAPCSSQKHRASRD